VSERPNDASNRRLPALLAAVGLLLSIALEVVHFRAYVSPSASSFCSAGARFDCTTVALSRWSVLFGVPTPLWGTAAFLAMTLLAWWRSRWLLPLAALTALGSVALLGIELFDLHTICLLCEGVHLASWALLYVAYRERASLTDTDGMTLVHLFTVPVGIVVIAHTILAPYWAIFSWKSGVTLPHGADAQGHYWIGAEDPKLVVHEYTDYSCEHCAVATSAIRRTLAMHPRSLRIVHHNYPRMRCPKDVGPLVCQFARAANCAGDQGKFWEMDSWLFEHAPGHIKVDFDAAARELGFDAAKLKACMDDPASYDRADAEARDAARAHVIDAPSYIIDGKKYVAGEVFRQLEERL
jgi:uncharacterized membrane protein